LTSVTITGVFVTEAADELRELLQYLCRTGNGVRFAGGLSCGDRRIVCELLLLALSLGSLHSLPLLTELFEDAFSNPPTIGNASQMQYATVTESYSWTVALLFADPYPLTR